jgi:hypothetical protein
MKPIFLEGAPDEQRTENTSKSKGLYFCKKLFFKTFGSCATIHINIFTEDRYTEKKLLKRAKNGDLGENVDFFKSQLLPPGSRQLPTAIGEQRQPTGWATTSLLKGTHARDFHRLFLTIFCIFQLLIDTKRSTAKHFRIYSSNSLRYSTF